MRLLFALVAAEPRVFNLRGEHDGRTEWQLKPNTNFSLQNSALNLATVLISDIITGRSFVDLSLIFICGPDRSRWNMSSRPATLRRKLSESSVCSCAVFFDDVAVSVRMVVRLIAITVVGWGMKFPTAIS